MKIIKDANTRLQHSNNDLSKFTSVRDRLLMSNDELRRINVETDPMIPADAVEEEFATAAEYNDQVIGMLPEQPNSTAIPNIYCF